ncbi:hypothetical protein MMC12_007669 [Toensbergia leucococca]|nr:hypothetical protein [Toensbergia leucococca]
MESSPLTQQARPDSFQPKIANLYDLLFSDDGNVIYSEGFWQEFFLLRPDKSHLQRRLETYGADDLLHLQHATQQLFSRAVIQVKTGKAPLDEAALDTLTVFLGGVLAKRYTNPSADIITVLAGLDEVDTVFSDFANAIETIIRTGRSLDVRQKAIEVALSLTSGAYQTSLVSYFTHRDLFPSLMKYIQDAPTASLGFPPFLLLGLLANYNKFEHRNPYRLRLEDFVNESTIQKIIQSFGATCALSRDRYISLQENADEGWNLSSTLSYIGLGVLAPSKKQAPTPPTEDAKDQFGALPGPEAAILLSAYDFTTANKLFSSTLLSCPAILPSIDTPLSAFLSLTSHILHHAHRSPRSTLYGHLTLLILRLLLEDPTQATTLSTLPLPQTLCRQIPPLLPPTPSPRPAASQILDIATDTLTHNLRLRLPIPLYTHTLHLLHLLLTHLSKTHTRLPYHWPHLWRTLLSLLTFLTTYSTPLLPQSPAQLLNPLLTTLALATTSGATFLPTPAAHDDLFYKLVEAGDTLARFKEAYSLYPTTATTTEGAHAGGGVSTTEKERSAESVEAVEVLIGVARHYRGILEGEGGKGWRGSPREVGRIIREGYEGLGFEGGEWVGRGWERFREGEERGLLKRVARVAVEDARRVVRGL